MAPQVETVRYIHNTEENRLTPGYLLITNAHPKQDHSDNQGKPMENQS